MSLHKVAILHVALLGALSGCAESSVLSSADMGVGTLSPSDGTATQQPTELTAGTWDDNLNYDWFDDYLAENSGMNGAPHLDRKERDSAHREFSGDRDARDNLDVAIVFDTTGSMGDELSYLTDAIASIAEDIEEASPGADVRWSLIVYRDRGDKYVTRRMDFTGDLKDFQKDLSKQEVAGGGDYPEASHEALGELDKLSWRTGRKTARLAFWFADAPHHNKDAGELTNALRESAEADVHLYPVAASGVDELAELTMRSAAQLTGGRYLFLTDDSGIGNDHKEPTIPCYFVTTLRHAMVRMVEIERSGVYVEPMPAEIIRTEGEPRDGRCELEEQEVFVF